MVIGEYMTTQNYLMVNLSTNVVENMIMWDGNNETWTPPSGYLMLVDETTPAKTWFPVTQINPQTQIPEVVDYVLKEVISTGEIGFIWDGTILTTNQPKPQPPYPPIPQV